jgi:CRP/FNR family transcriptional regulator, dissimilatory nitrate respiration regulator
LRERAEGESALGLVPLRLRQMAEVVQLNAGQVLRRLGDRVDSAFAVVHGEMRLIRLARNGREVILQRSRAGFFAEASLNAGSYHCDLVAAEYTEVLRFPVRLFRDALAKDTTFRNAWMTHLASEVRRARAQCERLTLSGAADRVLHYIESEGVAGVITLSETRKAWAIELGLTHECLYRTLRQMQARGVLRVRGPRFSLV